MSQKADLLLLLCSCCDGVCVWGAQCVTRAPVLVLVQSGMLSAWDLRLPPDSRCTGRQILSRVECLTPHPKGCPLVCLVETPGGGGGGGQQEQQSPHHCPGGAFLREGRGATRGTQTAPHLSSQHSSACQPHGLHPSSFWGNWEEHLCLGGQDSASWKPLQNLSCLRGGDALSTT